MTGRARHKHGLKTSPIQSNDMSPDGSGFHVGRFYQCAKLPADLSDVTMDYARLHNGGAGGIDTLTITVVCVRINELRKTVGNSASLRSSEGSDSSDSTCTVAIEHMPSGQDPTVEKSLLQREQHVHNVALIPLSSLGAEINFAGCFQ